ncbi:dihydroorotate dehydrogenase [bacterium]|nr:dihydroorotate dehydrogenase [bacterium]MCP5462905.1 dihydroorotate dehydrogenase [bacterium]
MYNNDSRLQVNKGKLRLKNPVLSASGTFGYGKELESVANPDFYGAIALKGITVNSRAGNTPPRLVEVAGGIINAIGLQNDGVKDFVKNKVLPLKKYDTAIVANINGIKEDDYCVIAEQLEGTPIDYIEINVSCPNLEGGGVEFGKNARSIGSIVKKVKERTSIPLMLKLTPQVTDITEMVRAAEDNGIDIVTLINTYPAMAIDINTRKPVLGNVVGGFSGPGVKPMAIRLIWEVKKVTNLPIIGMGGICGWQDAIEFMLAGADAVAVGTWHFIDPSIAQKINQGILDYMNIHGFKSVSEIAGYTWRHHHESKKNRHNCCT